MPGKNQNHWLGGRGVHLSQFSLDLSHSLQLPYDTSLNAEDWSNLRNNLNQFYDVFLCLFSFLNRVNFLGLTFLSNIFVPINFMDYNNAYFFSFDDLSSHAVLVLFAKDISQEKNLMVVWNVSKNLRIFCFLNTNYFCWQKLFLLYIKMLTNCPWRYLIFLDI